MELTVTSETSAIRTQTPVNYPKRDKLRLEHGESLKTIMHTFIARRNWLNRKSPMWRSRTSVRDTTSATKPDVAFHRIRCGILFEKPVERASVSWCSSGTVTLFLRAQISFCTYLPVKILIRNFDTVHWRRMDKISWTDHVRNDEVLLRVKEQRNILHEIRKRKANWIGHILRRNCLLQRVIEGKIKGGIEVTGRRGRKRRKLLDDLKERSGYSHL